MNSNIEDEFASLIATFEQQQAAVGNVSEWQARMLDGAAFALDVPDTVPAVWGHGDQVLWAEGEALMICGPQGVGKTTLAGQLIIARLGLVDSVLGFPVPAGNRRVLYLACDRPRQASRSLRRAMQPEWRDTLKQRLIVWQGPPPYDFGKRPHTLVEMCEAADADTVFVDSIKDVAIGLATDEVGAGYNRARQLAIRAGVEVCELHHQRKNNGAGGSPKSISDVYGSVFITSGAGSVVLLWGEPGDPVVELRHLKQPAEEVGPLEVLHDGAAGTSSAAEQVDLVYLVRHAPRGLTPRAAAVSLFEAQDPDRKQVEKARRKLDSYVRKGVMVKQGGTKGGVDGGTSTAYFLTERGGP